MALDTPVSLLVYNAGGWQLDVASEVQDSLGSNDLLGAAAVYPTTHERLSEPAELTVRVFSASEWIAERLLANRMRLVLNLASGDTRYFRIERVETNASGELSSKVVAREIWADLFDFTYRTTLGPSEQTRHWQPIIRNTAQEALQKIFALGNGLPETFAGSGVTAFALGTIEASLQTTPVILDANASSHGEMILSVCEQVAERVGSCEFEVRPDFSGGQIIIDFWEQIGLTATERSTGVTPERRPVSDREGNRVTARFTDTQEDYFSRVIPFAGNANERVGIENLRWNVVTCITSGGPPSFVTETLTLETDANGDGPIWQDGALVGLKLKGYRIDGQVEYATIDSTTAPATVVVIIPIGDEWCINPVVTQVEFMAPDEAAVTTAGEGVSLTYLPDVTLEAPGGPGRKDQPLDFRDHPPYANLLEGVNIVSDMRGTYVNWAAGVDLPVGWQPYPDGAHLLPVFQDGSMRSSKNTTDEFILFGEAACQVDARQAGIRTANLDLTPVDPLFPYVSFSVILRVQSYGMQARVFMVDADGVEWPAFQQLVSRNKFYTEFKASGFAPAQGLGYLVIQAVDTYEFGDPPLSFLTSTFYVDAAAVEFASVAPNYAEEMGPKFLWKRAARVLKDLGGLQDPEFETDFYAFDEFDAGPYDRVHIGSHCRIEELWDPATDSHHFNLDARAVELVREYHETHPTTITARFSRTRPRVSEIIAGLSRSSAARRPEGGIVEIIGGADPGAAVCLDGVFARDPTPTDDSTAGYCVNSLWTNTDSDTAWICVDDTPAAAIWLNVTTGEVIGPPGTPGTPGAPGAPGASVLGLGEAAATGGYAVIPAGQTSVRIVRIDDFGNIVPDGRVVVWPASALPPARQWTVPNEKIRGTVFSVDIDAADALAQTFGWSVDWPMHLGDKRSPCDRGLLRAENLKLALPLDELAGQVAHDRTIGGWNAIGGNSITPAAIDPTWSTLGMVFNRASSQYAYIDEGTDRFGTVLGAPWPLQADVTATLQAGCTVHSEPAHAFKHWVVARGSDAVSSLNYSLYFEDDGVDTFLRAKVHGIVGGPDIVSFQLNPTYSHGDFIVAGMRLRSNTLDLFIDGVQVASVGVTINQPVTTTRDIVLGNNVALAANEYYTGTIAYVRVHDDDLSDTDVLNEANYIRCVANFRDPTIALSDVASFTVPERGLAVPAGFVFDPGIAALAASTQFVAHSINALPFNANATQVECAHAWEYITERMASDTTQSPWWEMSRGRGPSAVFDGVDDYMDIADHATLQFPRTQGHALLIELIPRAVAGSESFFCENRIATGGQHWFYSVAGADMRVTTFAGSDVSDAGLANFGNPNQWSWMFYPENSPANHDISYWRQGWRGKRTTAFANATQYHESNGMRIGANATPVARQMRLSRYIIFPGQPYDTQAGTNNDSHLMEWWLHWCILNGYGGKWFLAPVVDLDVSRETAYSDGDPIGQLTDFSAQSNHAIQAGALRPTYEATNVDDMFHPFRLFNFERGSGSERFVWEDSAGAYSFGTSDFTLLARVCLSAATANGKIFHKLGAWSLAFDSFPAPFEVRVNVGTGHVISTAMALQLDTWYDIAVRINYGAGTADFYKDGVFVETAVAATVAFSSASNAVDVILGWDGTSGTAFVCETAQALNTAATLAEIDGNFQWSTEEGTRLAKTGDATAVPALPTNGLIVDLRIDQIGVGDGNPVDTVVNDGSAGNATAAGANRPTFRAAGGPFGAAYLEFDGTDDFLQIAHSADLNVNTGAHTIVMLGMRRSGDRISRYYLRKQDQYRAGSHAIQTTAQWLLGLETGTPVNYGANANFDERNWALNCWFWDGSKYGYFNRGDQANNTGEMQAFSTELKTPASFNTITNTTSNPLTIGADAAGANAMDMDLMAFLIYDRLLQPKELLQLIPAIMARFY